MQHVDPDVLALVALGEDAASASEREHLAACEHCRAELVELASVVETGRAVTPEDQLVPAAPAVWDRISAELGLGGSGGGTGEGSSPDAGPTGIVPFRGAPVPADAPVPVVDLHAASLPPVVPVTPEEDDAVGVAPPAPPAAGDATVADLSSPRRTPSRSGRVQMLVAACAALVVGVTGGILWERRGSEPQEAPIASATLDPLPDWPDARGEAKVKEVDGPRQVVIDLDAPTSADGYREEWLIASDLSGLVSLGVLQGQEGRFDIPAGLDLDKFSLVDVSEEHFDGDPAHSGDSIVRGPLQPNQA